jgi:hypothetical protein
MLEIQARQIFRSNGLIDDFVLIGQSSDYLEFSNKIKEVASSGEKHKLETNSELIIEIVLSQDQDILFTSFQNRENEYFSINDWNSRQFLRIFGNVEILEELAIYLFEVSNRGVGYSYISEFSEQFSYSSDSPEWRLQINET